MTAGTTALLVLAGAGVAGVVTLSGDDSRTVATADAGIADPDLGAPRLEESPEVVSRAAAAAEPLPQRHTPGTPRTGPTTAAAGAVAGAAQLSRARVDDERADRTGPRPARTAGKKPAERATPHRAPAQSSVAEPVVTTRTDVETRDIPFPTQVIRDPSLPRGTRKIESPGLTGEETLRYLVTLTDGRPTARILIGTEVTRAPEPRIVVFGARRPADRSCEGLLRLCMPLGRSAVCPEDGSGDTGGPVADGAGGADGTDETGDRDDTAVLTREELALLDPETLDRVRREPGTLCR
ncbi:G5 domain-containing protein [Actinoplanes sp. NPDC023936]|uniref:G5 domain-containing protein n=1 Tax=Actinoplanes sp. NPDC023936 TaxID=3154910 RepID=UPI0033F83444